MLRLFLASVLLISFNAFSQSSLSEEELAEMYAVISDTVKNKNGQILQEVTINGTPQTPPSVVRAKIKPMDLPQAIQIIDATTIRQQQSVRLSEVVKNANGVYISSARGGAQESLFSRGYDMSANNMFKNGFRFNNGSMPEVSSLEKVEILKGSAALLFGNVAPGGILNMVTKSPQFTKGGEVSIQAGSYSFYKPSVDIYGPLSKDIAYRFIGSYENSESFRDIVKNERIYFNPSVLFRVSDRTQILLQGDYLNADWTPDFGTAIIGKEIIDLPRDLYLGAHWSNGKTIQSSISALLSHELNKNWDINFNASYQGYDRESFGTERIQPADDGTWARPLGQTKNNEQSLGQQLYLQGIFKTGKIKHQIFTGADFDFVSAEAYTFALSPSTYGSGNIFDFANFDQGSGPIESTNTKIVKTDTNRFGVYFQDLISFTEKWKVLAGVRWSWQQAQPDTYNLVDGAMEPATGVKKIDQAFTPKAGLVFQPDRNTSLFASYANSFSPNNGVTVDGDPIKPSMIDQFEMGVKRQFFNGRLSTNLTLYQIVNSNLAQTAEFTATGAPNIDTNIKMLSGETTSKGIELDITGSPVAGLNIMGGYSYNDMRYTKTSGTNGSFIQGDRLVRTPVHTANLSFFYTLQAGKLKGLSFGALGNYIGDRFGGWNDQISINQTTGEVTVRDRDIPVDGYVTVDLSAGYNWNRISLLVKLSNVTDELNYVIHENYSVNPIAPRQILANLTYRFQ